MLGNMLPDGTTALAIFQFAQDFKFSGPKTASRVVCYDRIVVVVGDALHAMESTVRRFGVFHVNKLRRSAGYKMLKKKNIGKNFLASST